MLPRDVVMCYAKQDWTDDNPRSFIRLQMIVKIKQLWLKDRVKEWQEPQRDRNAIRKRATNKSVESKHVRRAQVGELARRSRTIYKSVLATYDTNRICYSITTLRSTRCLKPRDRTHEYNNIKNPTVL